MHRRVTLEVEHDTHVVFANVVDAETREVIRTIPTEELRELANRLHEVLGLLFNETA